MTEKVTANMSHCSLGKYDDGDEIMETNIVKNIIMAVLFFVFLGMIVIGQKTVGLGNLGLEIAGLAGLLAELYVYNRKYK